MAIQPSRILRPDYTFGTGLTDFLLENHKALRGKFLRLETLSRQTHAWGLEPELTGTERISALSLAIEASPYLDLATLGGNRIVAFAFNGNTPFPLLQMFLTSSLDAIELETSDIRVYVRRGSRFLNGEETPCLEIAKVTVPQRKQRKGILTEFITQIEAHFQMAIYIESIRNPVLIPFFRKRGYTLQEPVASRPCFYKMANLLPHSPSSTP